MGISESKAKMARFHSLLLAALCAAVATATPAPIALPTTVTEVTLEQEHDTDEYGFDKNVNFEAPRSTADNVQFTTGNIAPGECAQYTWKMAVGDEKKANNFDHSNDRQATVIVMPNAIGDFDTRLNLTLNTDVNGTATGDSSDCTWYTYGWYALGYRSPHALATESLKTHIEECPAEKPHIWDSDHLNDNWNWTHSGDLKYKNCTDGSSAVEMPPPILSKCGGMHIDSLFYVAGQEELYMYIKNTGILAEEEENDVTGNSTNGNATNGNATNGNATTPTIIEAPITMEFQAQIYKGWYDACSALEDAIYLLIAAVGMFAMLIAFMLAAGAALAILPFCCCAVCIYCMCCRKKNN